MIPTVFKSLGLLYFIMQQSVITLNSPAIHLPEAQILSESKKASSESFNKYKKVEVLNRKGHRIIENVAQKAAEKSKPLVVCQNQDCIQITPTDIPEISVITDPTIIVNPTIKIEPTIFIPPPREISKPVTTVTPLPEVTPVCGCRQIGMDLNDKYCPTRMQDLICLDSE